MKLVSAARLRRAQDAIVAARPYANALATAVAELVARAGVDAHPLIFVRPADRVDGSVVTKGRDNYRRRKAYIRHDWASPSWDTAANLAKELSRQAFDAFETGAVDAVYLVFNEFKSAIAQRTVVEQLIPVPAPPPTPDSAGSIDFVYEPSRGDVISTLIPLFIESQIYRALLESVASEFGARMTAMDSATTNARDMIGSLTLQYNRARQAAITKELMEIVGGAEALKG